MPSQRPLDKLNPRLPQARLKLGVRLTGIPYASRALLALAGNLVGKAPHHISIYHRQSNFFFPTETHDRTAQVKQILLKESQPRRVTSTITSTDVSQPAGETAANAASSSSHKSSVLEAIRKRKLTLRRDADTYRRLFPFTDFVDGCARGRACIGLSNIHTRGIIATSFIPKGGVALCVRQFDLLDPISMHLLTHSPRALPTLWRFYCCNGGAAFPLPLTPNPTHFLNHSCDSNLRAGFFYFEHEQQRQQEDGGGGGTVADSPELPPSMFVSDPRPWLECSTKFGEMEADSQCEAPMLRSLSQEEMYDFSNPTEEEKKQEGEETSTKKNKKKKKKNIAVDWNCYVAQRDIHPGEELTIDYARHIAPSYAGEFTSMAVSVSSPCNCGSKLCCGDMYRGVPARLDVVPSHELRIAVTAPYFRGIESEQRQRKSGDEVEQAEAHQVQSPHGQEEDFETFQRRRRIDPHDDDLVRASFLQNRQELLDKMHKVLPRTLLWKADVVLNTNATCQFLSSVLSKTKEAPAMPGTTGTVSPIDLH